MKARSDLIRLTEILVLLSLLMVPSLYHDTSSTENADISELFKDPTIEQPVYKGTENSFQTSFHQTQGIQTSDNNSDPIITPSSNLQNYGFGGGTSLPVYKPDAYVSFSYSENIPFISGLIQQLEIDFVGTEDFTGYSYQYDAAFIFFELSAGMILSIHDSGSTREVDAQYVTNIHLSLDVFFQSFGLVLKGGLKPLQDYIFKGKGLDLPDITIDLTISGSLKFQYDTNTLDGLIDPSSNLDLDLSIAHNTNIVEMILEKTVPAVAFAYKVLPTSIKDQLDAQFEQIGSGEVRFSLSASLSISNGRILVLMNQLSFRVDIVLNILGVIWTDSYLELIVNRDVSVIAGGGLTTNVVFDLAIVGEIKGGIMGHDFDVPINQETKKDSPESDVFTADTMTRPYGVTSVDDITVFPEGENIEIYSVIEMNGQPVSGRTIMYRVEHQGTTTPLDYDISGSNGETTINTQLNFAPSIYPYTIQTLDFGSTQMIGTKDIYVSEQDSSKQPDPHLTLEGFDSTKPVGTEMLVTLNLANWNDIDSFGGSGIHIRFEGAEIIGLSSSELEGNAYVTHVSTTDPYYDQLITVQPGWEDLSADYDLMEVYGEVPGLESRSVTIRIRITNPDPVAHYRSWLGAPSYVLWVDTYSSYQALWFRTPDGCCNQYQPNFLDYPTETAGGSGPTKVGNLVSSVTGSTVTLTWDAAADPDGTVMGYTIEESSSSSFTEITEYRGTTSTSAQFLDKGTPGEVIWLSYRVRAYDDKGIPGPYAYETVKVDRLAEGNYDAPTWVTESGSLSSTDFTISWNNPPNYSGRYSLEYTINGNPQTVNNPISGTYFTISGASFGQEYDFRVKVFDGTSDWSSWLSIHIDPPAFGNLIISEPSVYVSGSTLYVSVRDVHREGETTFLTALDNAVFDIHNATTSSFVKYSTLSYQTIDDYSQTFQYWMGSMDLSDVDLSQRYYVSVIMQVGSYFGNTSVPLDQVYSYFGGDPVTGPGQGAATDIADLDADGDLERIVPYANSIYIYQDDNTNFPGWPQTFPTSESSAVDLYFAYAHDITGDGELEIISRYYEFSSSKHSVYAYHLNGTMVAGFPAEYTAVSPDYIWHAPLIFYDMDSDGIDEIVYAVGLATDIVTIAIDGDGSYLSGFPRANAIGNYNVGVEQIFIDDFDRDGLMEIVVPFHNGLLLTTLSGVADGTPYLNANLAAYGIPIMANFYGDAHPEVLLPGGNSGRMAIIHNGANWRTTITLYSWTNTGNYGSTIGSIIGVGNFDSDPSDMELYVAGNWYAYHLTSVAERPSAEIIKVTDFSPGTKSLPTTPVFEYVYSPYTALVYDLEGDGFDELILGMGVVVDYQGRISTRHNLLLGNGFDPRFAVATDLDLDGYLDITTGGKNREFAIPYSALNTGVGYIRPYDHTAQDITPPEISWSAGQRSGGVYDYNLTVWDHSQYLDSLSIYLDDNYLGTYDLGNRYIAHIIDSLELTSGAHAIRIVLTDSHGNTREATKVIRVDTIPPTLLYSSIDPYWETTNTTAYIRMRFDDPSGLELSGTIRNSTYSKVITLENNWFNTTFPLYDGDQLLSIILADQFGNEARIGLRIRKIIAPAAPAYIFVDDTLNTVVNITWFAPIASGGTNNLIYYLFRSLPEDNSTFQYLGQTNSLFYTDIVEQIGVSYFYKILTHNIAGNSSDSGLIAAIPGTLPEAPILDSIDVVGDTLQISWQLQGDGGRSWTKWEVWRRGPSDPNYNYYQDIALDDSSMVFVDTPPTRRENYSYVIYVYNEIGRSPVSNNLTSLIPWVPFAPTNLDISPGKELVDLSWSPGYDGGSIITNYSVYRTMTSGTGYVLINNVSSTTFQDTAVAKSAIYYYLVTAWNEFGESLPSTEVQATPFGAPDAPVNIDGSIADQQVDISWEEALNNGGYPVLYYRIYRSEDNSSFSELTTTSSTSYSDTDLVNGQSYYYYITAINEKGESSGTEVTKFVPGTVPTSPLSLVINAYDNKASLEWAEPSNTGGYPILQYLIYRSTISGSGYVLQTSVISTAWNDTSVVNGITYYYLVTAVNQIGEGGQSNENSVTPFGYPSSPQNLVGIADDGSLIIGWSSPDDDGGYPIVQFLIYRSLDNVTFTLRTITSAYSYGDTAVSNGQTYYYRVHAQTVKGEGAPAYVSVKPGRPPSAPQELGTTPGDTFVSLSWTTSADDGGYSITVYNVYRSSNVNGPYVVIGSTSTLNYTDTELVNGNLYYYKVSAVNEMGESVFSTEEIGIPGTIPNAPFNLDSFSGDSYVMINWTAPVKTGGYPVNQYQIYRSQTPGGPYQDLSMTTDLYFNDTDVQNGKEYFYVITAINNQGESPYSPEINAKPGAIPDAPTGLYGLASEHQVELSWLAPADDGGFEIQYYRIFRSELSDSGFELVGTSDTLLFTDNSADNDNTYYYYVLAVNSLGEGKPSDIIEIVMPVTETMSTTSTTSTSTSSSTSTATSSSTSTTKTQSTTTTLTSSDSEETTSSNSGDSVVQFAWFLVALFGLVGLRLISPIRREEKMV